MKKATVSFAKRLDAYFVSFCRRAFHWSPEYRECRKLADAGGGLVRCKQCGACLRSTMTHVDHVEPVMPVGETWDDHARSWDWYKSRLFCPVSNLSVLCKPCHKKKSAREAVDRATKRKGA